LQGCTVPRRPTRGHARLALEQEATGAVPAAGRSGDPGIALSLLTRRGGGPRRISHHRRGRIGVEVDLPGYLDASPSPTCWSFPSPAPFAAVIPSGSTTSTSGSS
jgi:hypothetical protein